MLCTVWTELVGPETANKGHIDASSAADSCQIGQVCGGQAYLSVARVLFSLRAPARCSAPCAPMLFIVKLPKRATCKHTLTASRAADACQIGQVRRAGILEGCEGRIGPQSVSEMLGALCTDVVPVNAASKGIRQRRALSRAADSCQLCFQVFDALICLLVDTLQPASQLLPCIFFDLFHLVGCILELFLAAMLS